MNSIRQIQALNQRELESAVSPEASWHADYRDTAYIYIGGLPFDLSEGDILTIFSQFGEPVHLNLVRDKETGKSKGFAFLKYEDQRSTDLAVDNLGGATVMGRMLRVDHTRYERREEEGLEDNLAALVEDTGEVERQRATTKERSRKQRGESESDAEKSRKPRALLKEERELEQILVEHDDEDPMKEYLIKEKKEEVEKALKREARSSRHRETSEERRERHRHRRHHHHRHRKDDQDGSDSRDKKPSRRRSRSRSTERSRHRDKRDRSK